MKIMNRVMWLSTLLLPSVLLAQAPPSASFSSPHYWPPSQRDHYIEYEQLLNAVPSRLSLRTFHDQFGDEPHIAGTPGDARNIQRLAATFRMMGLDVQVHEFWAYLAQPIEAAVEIIAPDALTLPIKETALPQDRYSRDRALTIGFNAYSGNGDVTAEVVYANYGTKSDFEKLKELGVDCTGKIVIARYGGNFRGYKAKFAEQAGAAGLVLFTDPDDSGDRKGAVYPEGGWANESYIQRGSLLTLDYPGDPLTPGQPATQDAQRLDPESVALPGIPVQPIGYGAAQQILSRMTGRALPDDLIAKWQGGLPMPYRLEGGPDLRIRLMVKQERAITKTANVIGTMWGSTHPAEKIVIGCHHDAWCHGAGDPLAGTILVYEVAKSFFELAEKGFTPARTIVFAMWGAEEYGIIGSTEYCEQFPQLLEDALAYINLDAAAMGPHFSASAAPSLKRIIEEVTRDLPQIRDENQRRIHEAWRGDKLHPDFGNLGGGSDHVGFYCHLGIPSCGLSAGGAPGTAYHSNYDNLHWYRQVVGDDYEPAIMLSRVVNLLAARLACAPLAPLDPVQYAADFRTHVQALTRRANELGVDVQFAVLLTEVDEYEKQAREVMARLHAQIERDALAKDDLARINEHLIQLEREWLASPEQEAITGRAWFRNLFAASDPDSGYSAWMLPALRFAIEQRFALHVEQATQAYRSVFGRLLKRVQEIDAVVADIGTDVN